MHPNDSMILRFYEAFANGDARTMAECYHPQITFNDPAFGELQGEEVGKMWRLLIDRSRGGLKITYGNIQADENSGSADWRADYVFSATGRRVTNRIQAQFEFRDGLIIRHIDHFDLWRWARQAIGWKGWLLGWSGFFRNRLQKGTRKLLENDLSRL